MIRYLLVFVATTAFVMVGCSDGRLERVPVSGTVLIDGKPVPHGSIRFVPMNGRPAEGRLDENGRFTLSCFKDNDGTVLGPHKIAVYGYEQVNPSEKRWHAPKSYTNPETSGLQQEIVGPTEDLEINLTWGQGAPFTERIDADAELEGRDKT